MNFNIIVAEITRNTSFEHLMKWNHMKKEQTSDNNPPESFITNKKKKIPAKYEFRTLREKCENNIAFKLKFSHPKKAAKHTK